MNGYRYEDIYCGVVKISTGKAYLFLVNTNDLEVATTDVVNVYLHVCTK